MTMIKRDWIIVGVLMADLALVGLWRMYVAPDRAESQVSPPQSITIASQVVLGPRADTVGAASSPYTLVEFADYQCPPCGRAYLKVKTLLAQNQGLLKFTFRNYPLENIHPQAMPSAILAEQARERGQFWPVHDALFALNLSGHLDTSHLQALAQPASPDVARKAVAEDMRDAERLGVSGTPAFVLCCPYGKVVRLGSLSQVQQFIAPR
jgi:protein-disulfide isomerase